MASTVLLFGVTGLLGAITIGANMLSVAGRQTLAMQIIENEVTHARLASWSTVAAWPASSTLTIDSRFASQASGFTLTRTVSDVRTELRSIRFTVQWQGPSGGALQRSGQLYYGRNGLNVSQKSL